jgi:hypothetical protein
MKRLVHSVLVDLWVFGRSYTWLLLPLVILLLPVVAGRLIHHRWSLEGLVEHRRRRMQSETWSGIDLAWLVFLIISALVLVGVVGYNVSQARSVFHAISRDYQQATSEGLSWWIALIPVVDGVGAALFCLLSIALPYVLMQAAWARTQWGWRSEVAEAVVSDPPVLSRSQDRIVGLMLFACPVLLVTVIVAGVYQWSKLS